MNGADIGARLFVFEGGECCGKSTVMQSLTEKLKSEGYDVANSREPGGSKNAERIRETIMACEGICTLAEALLFAASRAENVQKTLKPMLDAGKIVLLDRFVYTSLAYQGMVKGLGLEATYEINKPAIAGVDVTAWFYLDVSPEEAMRRMKVRGEENRLDRFGMESANKLRAAYTYIAQVYGGTIIDANKSPEEMLDTCYREIKRFM